MKYKVGLLALLFCSGFLLAHKTQAYQILNTDTGTYSDHYNANYGAAHPVYSFGNVNTWNTTTGNGTTCPGTGCVSPTSSPVIQSITVLLVRQRMSDFTAGAGGTYSGHIQLVAHGSNFPDACTSDNYIENSDLAEETPTWFTFTFSSCTLNFDSSSYLTSLELPGSNNGYSPVFNADSLTDPYQRGTLVFETDSTAINTGGTGGTNSYYVKFQSPQFRDNMTTPDFGQWWLCLNIPANHTQTAYSYAVSYGTSSPTGIGFDDETQTFGAIPLTAGKAETLCPFFEKSASSTPGTYQAKAYLYDQSYATITQSSILHFTVSGGDRISSPPTVEDSTAGSCTPTSFALNFGFGTADFGKGLCELGRFLFVPTKDSLTQFTGSQSVIATKPPFNWFYNLAGTLQNVASSTASSSMTSLTISAGSTSSPFHISGVDMFSNTTIEKYTSPTSRGLLRTLCEYAIYLAFAAMVILEVRHLFSNKKPQ